MVINFPQSQEFMVSRIFSVVRIFLDPLMDEFILMEVLKRKGELITVGTKKCLGSSSHSNQHKTII